MQHAWVLERLERFSRVLEPGLNILIPIVDSVAYKFDLRESPLDVAKQVCITKDNMQISIDGVLYMQITDPKAAAYGTSNPLMSVVQLAQTIMAAWATRDRSRVRRQQAGSIRLLVPPEHS